MTWFNLKRQMASNAVATPEDTVNTKMALNQLGYYPQPESGTFGNWVDRDIFKGIRQFQEDHGLNVDGYMNPEGPTEAAINHGLANRFMRPTSLGGLEAPSMCACSASDDNPWPS